jgi:pilus assembly protein TadC
MAALTNYSRRLLVIFVYHQTLRIMMLVFTSIVLFYGTFFWQAFKLNKKSAAHHKHPAEMRSPYGSFA